jgi:hypothetical protein
MILKFGKYQDQDIRDVPREYLEWLLQSNKETVRAVEEELVRRELAEEASLSWIEKIALTGYRELAKRHHPDAGGQTRDMQEINAASDRLREMIKGSQNGGKRR